MASAKNSHPPKFGDRRAEASLPSAKYIGKTTPYKQQTAAFNHVADLAYCALFMQQGTGKTKVAIDKAVYNFEKKKIEGFLVVCPKSLTETWCEEIATHCPDRVKPIVAVWKPSLPKFHVTELESILYNTTPNLPILIVNIEGIRTPKLSKLLHWWARHKKLFIACDESSKIKTPSAKQTLAAANLAALCKSRMIMTGTPVSNSPADYYSQLQFLMPMPIGFSNFYSFRARYCVLENKTITLRKPRRNKNGTFTKTQRIIQIKGPQNADELKRKLLPFSYFVKKDECLDLPPKIYHKRFCELTKEGAALYKDVAKKILIEIEEQRELTIEVTLARLLRLQQVTGGFLPDDEEKIASAIPGNNPKLDLLLETIEQFPGPTIIWARFKPEHIAITRLLQSIVPNDQIGEITGRVKKDDRDNCRKDFQAGRIHYLVCTQSCAGYGYTLTAAENEIYYSNTFSLEHREQSEDRAHRIGLTHKVNIIDLLCRAPQGFKGQGVDLKIHDTLIKKRNVADMMTDVSAFVEMLS